MLVSISLSIGSFPLVFLLLLCISSLIRSRVLSGKKQL